MVSIKRDWRYTTLRGVGFPLTLSCCVSVLFMGAASLAADESSAASPQPFALGINEIVVTAQRRTERIQDVPMAVTLLNPRVLDQREIKSVRQLSPAVPGLLIDAVGGNTIPAIRGVTTLISQAGSVSNVALYLDGVYQPVGQANDLRLNDVERIEVLKGPQGTLYGRNATGGSINIYTAQPSFTPSGKVSVGYGSFDTVELNGFVNGPLVGDVVAGSLSANYSHSDGYVKDFTTGRSVGESTSYQLRSKVFFQFSDPVSLLLTAHLSYLNDPSVQETTALNGNSLGRVVNAVVADRPYTYSGSPAVNKSRQYGGAAKLSFDANFATLTSLTAYSRITNSYALDADGSSAPFVQYISPLDRANVFQEEVNLTSNAKTGFQWILGAGYYSYNALSLLYLPLPPDKFGVYSRTPDKAGSVFGEATIPFFDHFDAILGFRYTKETVTNRGSLAINPPTTEPFPFVGKSTYDKFTPRVTVQYKPSAYTNIYATFTQGFKSGLFDSASGAIVKPENLTAYEVGIKTSELSGGLTLNAEGFYYDYTNQQVQEIAFVNSQQLVKTTNSGKSRIYGFDGELIAPVTSDFSVHAGLSLLHAKVLDYPNASVLVPSGIGGNNQVVLPNARSKTLPRAPKFTLSITADYTHEFNFGAADISATYYHSGRIFYDYNNRITQPDYSTLSASAGWTSIDKHWRVSVVGRNLTDKRYLVATVLSAYDDGVFYAAPRSISAKIQYSY